MDEDTDNGSSQKEDEELDIIPRRNLEELYSRKAFEHTWDVAVPGEEDLPLLPRPGERPEIVDTDSEKADASEEKSEKDEPEVLIQFENQEENLLSKYENEDSCDNEDSYCYDDQYDYDGSYDCEESYEYDGSYDYSDPYGLNQLMLRRNDRVPHSVNNNSGIGPRIPHPLPPPNFWMNNPSPRMMGSMRMPGFGSHMPIGQPPGPRAPMLPFRGPRPPMMMNPSSSVISTPSANPSPTTSSQSPQIQNILNQASLLMQMQNSGVNTEHPNYHSANSQSLGYGSNYQDPSNPNFQSYSPFNPGSTSSENYRASTDLTSVPEAPGTTEEPDPPGRVDDAYSPDDPTPDEALPSESDTSQVVQSTSMLDVSDIPTPQTPEKSETIVKMNVAEVAETANVLDSPKTPKPVLGKAQAKKRLMAFANKFGILPKVQPFKPKAKVDTVVGKADTESKQYTPDNFKEKGKGKVKDKVKSLLEELNDAKLKIESALEAQQQNSSSGKSKKHHEDRVPAIEEIVREESISKGVQDYINPSLNAERELSGRIGSGEKGRWRKPRYNHSDEENSRKSTPSRKLFGRRRRYSKDRERDYKAKDDKSIKDQQTYRISQDKDPRKREKEKRGRESRRNRGDSKEKYRKDFNAVSTVRISKEVDKEKGKDNEKEKEKIKDKEKEKARDKDKEKNKEKEKDLGKCRNWVELKKSRLSWEEIVSNRKEDRPNKNRTAQDYAQHFNQMLMIGDYHLKRYPLIVEGQEGPREFPPESVKVTKRGRGPPVLFSENPRISLLLNRQQLYQAVSADCRDKMRQICEATYLQINPLEEVQVNHCQSWYERMEDLKSLEKASVLPPVVNTSKSKWESPSTTTVSFEEQKKEVEAVVEVASQKDEIFVHPIKKIVEIESFTDINAKQKNLIPELAKESHAQICGLLCELPANDVLASQSPRNCDVSSESTKLTLTKKDNSGSTSSTTTVRDQKLVSEYEQFIKMVSDDGSVPVSCTNTTPSTELVSRLSTYNEFDLKKNVSVIDITASSKIEKIIEKIPLNDKSNAIDDSEVESIDEFGSIQGSILVDENKLKTVENIASESNKSESEVEAGSSSKDEESDGSSSVPSDWENVEIKEEKMSDENLDKKISKRKKKRRKSSSDSTSSSSSSSSDSSESEEEVDEEEQDRKVKKSRKKYKRKLIRKKSKKKVKSSSESDSSEDLSSESSSEDDKRKKKSRRKRKSKKKTKRVIAKKKRKRRMKTDSDSSDSDKKARKKKKKNEKELRRKQREHRIFENEDGISKKKSVDTKVVDKRKVDGDRRESLSERKEVKEEKMDFKKGDEQFEELRTKEKKLTDKKKHLRECGYDDNLIAIEEPKDLLGEKNVFTLEQNPRSIVVNKKKDKIQDKFLKEWEKEGLRMTQQITHQEEITKDDLNNAKRISIKDKYVGDAVKIQREEKFKDRLKEVKLLEDWERNNPHETIHMTQQISQEESMDIKRKSKKISSEWEDDFGLMDNSNVASTSLLEKLNKRKDYLTDEWEVDSLEENKELIERKRFKSDKRIDKGIKYDKKTDTYIAVDRESAKDHRKKQNRLSAIRIWEEEEEEGEKEAMMLMEQKSRHKKKDQSKKKWNNEDLNAKSGTEVKWRSGDQSDDEAKREAKHWEKDSQDSISWLQKVRDLEYTKSKKRRSQKQENQRFEEYYKNDQDPSDQNRDDIHGKVSADDWLIMQAEEVSSNKSYSNQTDSRTPVLKSEEGFDDVERTEQTKLFRSSHKKDWKSKDTEKTSDWEEIEENESVKMIRTNLSEDIVSGWIKTLDRKEADQRETLKMAESSWQNKKNVSELKKDKKSRWDVEKNANKSKDLEDMEESQKNESDKLLLIEWEEEHNEWVKNAASTFDEIPLKSTSYNRNFARSTLTPDDTASRLSTTDRSAKKSKKPVESCDSQDLLNLKKNYESKYSSESQVFPEKHWSIEDEDKSHNSLSSLIELNFKNTRPRARVKNVQNSDETSEETKSPSEYSLKDNKNSLELYSPSSPALSQKSEDMEISSGSDMDQSKANTLLSNIPLPSDEFPLMFGCQVSSIPIPVSSPVQNSNVNTNSSTESKSVVDILNVPEKSVQNSQFGVKISEITDSPKAEFDNVDISSITNEQLPRWESKDSDSKKISSKHSDKSSVSSSSAEMNIDRPKDGSSMDIFADYESSSDSCKKTESENDLLNSYEQLEQKEDKLKSPLKLIPKQILIQHSNEAKSKSNNEPQKTDIVQGTISFKIQKKVLQTNVLPSDENEDTGDAIEKSRKPENQFSEIQMSTIQKAIINRVVKLEEESSIHKKSDLEKDRVADVQEARVINVNQFSELLNDDKKLLKFEELKPNDANEYDDFLIDKRDVDETVHCSHSRSQSRSRSRSLSQTPARSRSRSRSRDRRKKSPERRERDRWNREDRRRNRGVETRDRDRSGKRERLDTPTQESRTRSTRYMDRGESRRRSSPSKGRSGNKRNRSRSPLGNKRLMERSRSRSPMTRRDRDRSPKRRGDGDKKITKLSDRLDEKDEKGFFKDEDISGSKCKIFEDRRERSLKSPIRYPVSTPTDDNNRKFGSAEHKMDKERDRGRYRDSIEKDRESRSYDPMEILREKGFDADRYRKRSYADNEGRKYQWKYEGDDEGGEDNGEGLFPNEFDLDFEEGRLGRSDSLDRDIPEGSISSLLTSRSKHRERGSESRSKRSRERGKERESPSFQGREDRSYSRSRSPPRSAHVRGSVDRYKSSCKSRSRSRTPDRITRSTRRRRSRSPSLVRDDHDPSLGEKCTTGRRIETIVQSVATVTGITGVIPDSTISDSELLGGNECINHDGSLRYVNNGSTVTNEYYYYSEGNLTYPPRIDQTHQPAAIGTGSPKRLSLDDRLELELGIKKKQQEQIPLNIQDSQHVGYHPAAFSTNIATYPSIPSTPMPPLQQQPYPQQPPKVLQVGNVLQVIPSEFAGIPAQQRELPASGVSSSSHVVRVGNVLQVVPTTLDWAAGPSPSDTINSAYHRPCQSATPIGVPPPSPVVTLISVAKTSPTPVPRSEPTPAVVQPVYNYEAFLEERKKAREERKKIREERRKEKESRRLERRKRRAERLVKKNLTLRQQEGATFQLQHVPSPTAVLAGLEDEEDDEINSKDQSTSLRDSEQYQQTQQKEEQTEETIGTLNEEIAKEVKDGKNDWLPLLPPPAKGILISPGFGRESMSNGNPGYLFEQEEQAEYEEQSEEREQLETNTESEFALTEEQVESQLQAIIEESKTKDAFVVGKSREEEKELDVRRKKLVRRKSRKSVQFADGVRPGEGTSPSGGEGDMPSPPPPTSVSVLPLRNSNIINHTTLRGAEKRLKTRKSKKKYQKSKPPKAKKKVKVKIIKLKKSRVAVPSPLTIEDLDELDERSPPPPPPGSPPPPHLWPSYLAAYNATMCSLNPLTNSEPPTPPPALASPPPTPLPLLIPPPPLNYTIQPLNKA